MDEFSKEFNDDDDNNEQKSIQKLVESYRFEKKKNEQINLIITENMEKVASLENISPSERYDAIVTLHAYVIKRQVNTSLMPKKFISNFISLFTSPLTNISIKTKLLSLSDDMMKYCNDFVEKFAAELYFVRVYDEMRRNSFRVEQCLPVLDHFIIQKNSFSCLNLSNLGYLEFLISSLEKEQNRSSIPYLYNSLMYFTGSDFFLSNHNDNLIFMIADHCLEKIIPSSGSESFNDLETRILVPIILTLSNLLKHISTTQYMDNIINSDAALIIMSLFNDENVELSAVAVDFLFNSTYYSDIICIQLQKFDIVQYIMQWLVKEDPENEDGILINERLYGPCALKCLRIIYNTFVICSNSSDQELKTYIFLCSQDELFKKFLKYIMNDRGSSLEKSETFSILAIVFYILTPDYAITLANYFEIQEYILDIIDANYTFEDIYNALIISQRLAEIFTLTPYNSSSLSNFREVMLTKEMEDSLNEIKLTQGGDVLERVNYLLGWIDEVQKLMSSSVEE